MLLNRYLFSAFPQKAEEVVSGARKAYSYMQREYGPQMTREQVVTAMLEGRTFQEVSSGSRMPVKRAMAYRLLRAVRTQGPIARPRSAAGPSQTATWRGSNLSRNLLSNGSSYAKLRHPNTASRAVRREGEYQPDQPRSETTRGEQPLQEQGAGEKTAAQSRPPSQEEWQEGAGSLLRLSAGKPPEALTQLETALAPRVLAAAPSLRLARLQPATLRCQLLTLLLSSSGGTPTHLGSPRLQRPGSGAAHESPPCLQLSPHRAVFSRAGSGGSR